ncbi:MAG: hypothetical protein AAF192_04700 [Pseudomonadota bacterium]
MRLLATALILAAGLATGGVGASAQGKADLDAAAAVCAGPGPLAAMRAQLRAAGFQPVPGESRAPAAVRLAFADLATRVSMTAGDVPLRTAYAAGLRTLQAWLTKDPGPGTTRAVLAGPGGAKALTLPLRQFADDRSVRVSCFIVADPSPALRFDEPTTQALQARGFVSIAQKARASDRWDINAHVTLFNVPRTEQARPEAPRIAFSFVSRACRPTR